MIFEVKARKPDSPDFDAASERSHFQQTRFWAEFKAAQEKKEEEFELYKFMHKLRTFLGNLHI